MANLHSPPVKRGIQPHAECCPFGCCKFRKMVHARVAAKERACAGRKRKSLDEFIERMGLGRA